MSCNTWNLVIQGYGSEVTRRKTNDMTYKWFQFQDLR